MSEKLLQNPKALCNIVRRIALEAGDITLRYFDESGFGQVQTKQDNSPVTIADQETERFIEKALADVAPDILFVGEEAIEEKRVNFDNDADYYWCVDPIDGTKDFIAGEPDFTVNIALIHKSTPILGVIYAPAHGELYAGCGENTAIRWLEDTDIEKSIHVRTPPSKGYKAIISKRASEHENFDKTKLAKFLETLKLEKTMRRSSSIKLCYVASGKADLYPCFGRTCLWDTAAGEAIIRSAGGSVSGLNNSPLDYTFPKDGNFYNPPFVATGFDFEIPDLSINK